MTKKESLNILQNIFIKPTVDTDIFNISINKINQIYGLDTFKMLLQHLKGRYTNTEAWPSSHVLILPRVLKTANKLSRVKIIKITNDYF